ncbi:unnamed protein product, partial [Phaeothamnion confervicola]
TCWRRCSGSAARRRRRIRRTSSPTAWPSGPTAFSRASPASSSTSSTRTRRRSRRSPTFAARSRPKTSPPTSGDRLWQVKRRRNVLLLGDSLGDLSMAAGLDSRTLLTIGFLNDRVPERLNQYLAVYDVVIIGDAGLEFIAELLRELN